MKRYVFLLILFPAVIYSACKSQRPPADMDTHQSEIWINPEIMPRFHPQIESITRLGGAETDDASGMDGIAAFCNRMNAYFSESGLGVDQADEIYELLHASGILFNESVGMPDPDYPLEKETVDDFRQRISIKHSGEGEFEIFYLKTSCGFTYFYGVFILPDDPRQLNMRPREVWRASVPC